MSIKVTGKGNISAKIIADSASSIIGQRITTFELEYPRFIHAEVMTHRMFSRNAASSRAIPVKAMLEQIHQSPAMPIHWGKNQAGMQAKEEMDWQEKEGAKEHWRIAMTHATHLAESISSIGCHKQIVNRLVEPFQMIKVVMTATSFDNFFWLRNHEDAQPEIKELARCMLAAYMKNTPVKLEPGEWHTPYFGSGYWSEEEYMGLYTLGDALMISASCCAQVSYRKSDDSLEKAKMVWERLVSSQPVHASPTEHQATPMRIVECDDDFTWEEGATHMDSSYTIWSNNFKGWVQHRALIDGNVCNDYNYSAQVFDNTGLTIAEE